MKAVFCGRYGRIASIAFRFLLLCASGVVLMLMLSGAVVSKYIVTIENEDARSTIYTSEEDPLAILANAKILIGPHDEISFSGFDEHNQASIVVNRAHLVTVTADGSTRSTYVTDGTVGDTLSKMGITVNADDYINVSLAEPVESDMGIAINRVTYNTVIKTATVPFEILEIPTQTLKDGRTRSLSSGKNGERTTEIKQTLLDGVLVEEEVISDEITTQPVSAQVLVGDHSSPVTQLTPDSPIELDANGNPVNYLSKVTGRATAYSALGKRTKLVPGCVAMDLSDFPRGTRLYIKTPDGSFVYGYSEVRDTGTAMIQDICLVDLFFDSYLESCLFGVKTVDVYILP